jgi:hypothetical protein
LQKISNARKLFNGYQVRDIHMQKWCSELQRGGTKRERYLDITGGIFNARAYLKELKSRSNRRKFACFRTGSHVFRVETGRWSNEAHVSRVCPLGCSAAVENEFRFILNAQPMMRLFVPSQNIDVSSKSYVP